MGQSMPGVFDGIGVIINADDLLLHESIDRAILLLFEECAISNATAMMCLPESERRLRQLKEVMPTRKIGVHLQLTSGKPLLSDVPSLVSHDTEGFLDKRSLANALADEVEREWRAQIELFCSIVGHRPSHFDTHHGPHRLDHLLPVYLRLADEYAVPVRGGNRALGETIASRGLRTTSVCLGDWTGRGQSADVLMERILEYHAPGGPATVEVVSHPSLQDPRLRKVSSLNDARFTDFSELRRFRKLAISQPQVKIFSYEARL